MGLPEAGRRPACGSAGDGGGIPPGGRAGPLAQPDSSAGNAVRPRAASPQRSRDAPLARAGLTVSGAGADHPASAQVHGSIVMSLPAVSPGTSVKRPDRGVRLRRWTRDEYYRAWEAGIFGPEERLE